MMAKVKITNQDKVVTFELNDSGAAKSLLDQLPLTINVKDYSSVDGSTTSARLFNSAYAGDSYAINFKPINPKTYDDGTLWLRYQPIK